MAVFRREEGLLTPERAAELLAWNTHNRTAKQGKIAAMVKDIEAGRWLDTDIPVIVYQPPVGPPVLQDGQNRCTAVTIAGIAAPIPVSWVDEAVYEVVDTGTPRSHADRIHTDELSRETGIGKTALAACQTGLLLADFYFTDKPAEYARLTPTQRLDYYHQHLDEIVQMVDFRKAWKNGHHWHCTVGILAGVARIQRLGTVDHRRFLNTICSIEGLYAGMPEHAFWVWVEGKRNNGNFTSTWALWKEQCEMVIRAWNARARGIVFTTTRGLRVHGVVPPVAAMAGGTKKGDGNGAVRSVGIGSGGEDPGSTDGKESGADDQEAGSGIGTALLEGRDGPGGREQQGAAG